MGKSQRCDQTSRAAAYNLTKLGKGLMPMFKNLLTWGTKMLAAR